MIGIKMNQVLILLALACAAAEPLAKPSAEVAVDGNDGKVELVLIPNYTMWLKDLDSALAELKSHLLNPDHDNNPNGPFVQYVMIVNAVNQLVEASLPNGSLYDEVFFDVVSRVILETIKSPQESADTVRAQADKSNAKTASIRDLTAKLQNDSCKDPESYACDLIIGITVQVSGDELLKRQAHFMQTLSREFELFLRDYAAEFKDVSNNKRSSAYLINGKERLKPLVMAALKTRLEGKVTPPILFRSTGV